MTETQRAIVLAAVLANPVNAAILSALSDDILPNWYLTASSVCQAVWNRQCGREPADGVSDYDVFYYDDTDLSYEAEDRAVRRALALPGMPANRRIEIRNQARVHLWYADRFGAPCRPLTCTEDGIDQFLTRSMAVGVRRNADGALHVYAVDGLDDLVGLRIRPNVVAGRRELYEEKARSYAARWPALTIDPWPG